MAEIKQKQMNKNSQAILDINIIFYDEENQYKLQNLMQIV